MRGYLLDTCVIFEATRPRPSTRVRDWILAKAPEQLFLSVVSITEIEQGIASLDQAGKAKTLKKCCLTSRIASSTWMRASPCVGDNCWVRAGVVASPHR